VHDTSIIFSLFLVFAGAALIATLALYARQALLIAYILVGVLLGPWAFNIISEPALIADIANIGILFLTGRNRKQEQPVIGDAHFIHRPACHGRCGVVGVHPCTDCVVSTL